jgi:hypothetical protein
MRIRLIHGALVPGFALLLLACVAVSQAESANVNATPSLSLGASYDSNILNSSSNEESDYVFRAVPRLVISLESPTTKAEFGGAIEAEKYADHDELDNADATKSVDFRLVRTGPRSTISPSARYVETNDITRRYLFAPSDIPITEPIVPVETLIAERVQTKEYSGALQISYLVSPKVTLGIGGAGLKRDFSANTSGYTGSKTWTGNGSVSYQFTSRFFGGLSFNTSYNTFEGRPNSHTYSGELTGRYNVTEKTTLNASAGATYLRESTGVGDEKNDEWSPTGSLALAYAERDFRATLLGSYAVAGGGSFGTTTKRGTLALAFSNRFARWWSWDLSGSYQRNRSTGDQTGGTEDVDTVSGAAGMRYEIVPWASVRLSGNIYRQRSDSSLGQDLDRETVLLELNLGKTFNLF